MPEGKNWHLSKCVTVSLILSILGTVVCGSIAWANTMRDIEDNKISIEAINPKLTAIYEGLLVRGVIDPMDK